MPTITPVEFTKLVQARHLQVEKYRTAYFAKEKALPSDDDPMVDRQWLLVKYDGDYPFEACIPVGLLSKWADTFDTAEPLTFEPQPDWRVLLSRGTSKIRVMGFRPEYMADGTPFRKSGRYGSQIAVLDAPVKMTQVGDSINVEIPDITAELAKLKATTTDNRKAIAREKLILKTRKTERDAKERLERAVNKANEAQAVLDGMTLKEAIRHSCCCLYARRLYRSSITNVESLPDWMLPSFTREFFNCETQSGDTETVDSRTVYGNLLAIYQSALDALNEYKPRLSWPSYVGQLAKEAGMSVAAYKKANQSRAFKTYGPTFDKLKEAKNRTLKNLICFVRDRFEDYCIQNGLPKCIASEYAWDVMSYRTYSRARQHLKTWEQRKVDLESQVFEATKARENAES